MSLGDEEAGLVSACVVLGVPLLQAPPGYTFPELPHMAGRKSPRLREAHTRSR